MEGIGTRLSDGIDGTTCKTRLTDIKRSHAHLYLINCLCRNRLSTSLTTILTIRSETENIVVYGTINLEAVITVINTSKRHCSRLRDTYHRIHTGDITDTMTDRRHIGYILGTIAGSSTSLAGIQA